MGIWLRVSSVHAAYARRVQSFVSASQTSFIPLLAAASSSDGQAWTINNGNTFWLKGMAAAMFPVLHTFIHFAEHRHTRRTQSNPPACLVDVSIREADTQRIPRRRRRPRPSHDDRIISEYQQLARLEAWRLLAHMLVMHRRRETRSEVRLLQVTFRAATTVPVLQETVPLYLFLQIADYLTVSSQELSEFYGNGILRHRDSIMEIWTPVFAPPARQRDLLQTSRLFKRLDANGEILLRLPYEGGVVACPMHLGREMTVEDLKAVAAASSGIRTVKQRMSHLGTELGSGLVVDNGVCPGSCIIVTEIIER